MKISIENEELREIRTLGEVKTFITNKLSGTNGVTEEKSAKVRYYDRLEITSRLPQQPPFLFVDEAQIEGETVRARYTVRGDEFFLEGHFKDNPGDAGGHRVRGHRTGGVSLGARSRP